MAILTRMLWWWALLWFLLLLGAGLLTGLLAWRLWIKAKALTAELNQASGRLTEVLAALNDLTEQQDRADDFDDVGPRPGGRSRRASGPAHATSRVGGQRRAR